MTDCIFCRILKKEIPSKAAYEDETVYAFHDVNPQAPTHILIVPKKHIADINHITKENRLLVGDLIDRAKEIARQKKVEDGYRLVINNGAKAGQSVFHIHLHLLGGRRMSWPPG